LVRSRSPRSRKNARGTLSTSRRDARTESSKKDSRGWNRRKRKNIDTQHGASAKPEDRETLKETGALPTTPLETLGGEYGSPINFEEDDLGRNWIRLQGEFNYDHYSCYYANPACFEKTDLHDDEVL